jgi:hypothetical protein
MDKTLAGLLGSAAALVAIAPAQAATIAQPSIESVMQAGSYGDLLQPIPNALALLRAAPAVDAVPAARQDDAGVRLVEYHHHHHHHHHRRHHHHHHHYY